jgi:ABC-type siderophore export system fused ATPase/permease subunit
MPALMLLLYYSYQSFFKETLPLDLANGLVTIAAGAFIAYRLTKSKKNFSGAPYRIAALLIVLALLAVYAVFTFAPPDCDPFRDPSWNATCPIV